MAALVVLLLLANNVSRYRDFQLSEIAAYVVVVAGLTVLTGLNGQISLGHGALMAVGRLHDRGAAAPHPSAAAA